MSSSTLPVTLACCGLLGTMADDHGMLERAFAEACATQGIVPGTAAYAHYMVGVHQARGQSAVDVFRGLFPDGDGRAEAAALSFERSFRTAVDRTGISPVPGGMGVVEAGMIFGLTAAGISETDAVAAVFVQRLFTAYLPPIWGWGALVWMRKKEYL